MSGPETGTGSGATANGTPLFALEGVGVRVETRGVLDRVVLDDLSLRIPERAVLQIVGRSGAGKTTLLRMLSRLVEPTTGIIRFRGRPLTETEPVSHRRTVMLVPQSAPMLPGTVQENLTFPLGLRRFRDVAPKLERAARLLHRFGLEGAFMESDAARLSDGERHRVALVRALLLEPEVLLLDELGAALDGPSAAAVLEHLALANREQGLALVTVTHRLSHIRRLGGALAFLSDGRIAETGTIPAVLDAPRTATLRVFLRALEP